MIFQGANGYVSPNWYASKAAHGKVVPTWNYVVAHVYGRMRAVEDAGWLRAHVDRLTTRHEAAFASPWSVDDAPAAFTEKMLSAVVGLEIEISRIEGKWKVSQNRPAIDREGVVNGLRAQGSEAAAEMADHVEAAKR